jgi:hypothetical protein
MSKPLLPGRWKELAPLLDAALEREAHERPAFIDRACVGDPALCAELEMLLAECARPDRLFASVAVERFAALLAEPPREVPEIVAERYQVGREIGAGGMATIYLARDLKHDRDVALKVLRADLSAVIGAERFLAEVRITAKLDHPRILTLIDSGSADGILFYVLPYVRGESLRAKLTRERQFSLSDALSIARQVATALDYAHTQGVVHRDVKPENILLHEGEAILADFGIALAVEEAGGNRLTGAGLSLGTPQYMSPEQATGDRALDARSDIYSLAAVLYEMIAGEPPVTGATKQAIIAKLLTEHPTKLRVVRPAVPEGVERAVDKALSKVPADRFATAGAFTRALDAAGTVTVAAAPRRLSTTRILAALGVAAGVAVIGLGALFASEKIGGRPHAGITLADRRQLTFTGQVALPTISGDGKTLAYRTMQCTPGGCTFGIELQDVGGPASRRIFGGASSIYRIEWSPDRRYLLFTGTINPIYGTFLVSALGGTPRRVPYRATFFAGGDSLLFPRVPFGVGATKWVLVSGLDGVARDSVRVGDDTDGLVFFGAVPGSKWIVVAIYPAWDPTSPSISMESRVVARDGRVTSRTVIGHSGTNAEAHASSDALWVSPGGVAWPKRVVFRIPLDAASGKLSSRIDTLSTGLHTGFSVTADGGALVLDEGSTEFGLWGLDMNEAIHGVFPEEKRLLHSTSALNVRLSPNGERVLVGRDPGRVTNALQRWSTTTFRAGGAETPLALAGATSEAIWSDNTTVAIKDRILAGARFALVDVATGAVREALDVPDRYPSTYSHLPGGGWVWVRAPFPELSMQLPNQTSPRRIRLPAWYAGVFGIDVSRDGRLVALSGVKAPDTDSVGLGVITPGDTVVTSWFTTFGEGAEVNRLKDGSFLLRLHDTPETYSLYHIRGPGRAEKIGSIPRTVSSLSVSEDLKRAAVVVREYHGDAWMSRVVRP